MGFSSSSVVEALVTYDNGTEKALAHFLDGSSWCYLMILEIVYCGRDLSFSVCIFLLYSLLSMMRFVEIQVGINIPHMKKDLMVKKISNGWEVVV
ncbi:uncharacterized protein J3R85_008894 [Psidium guajava]|nr:uncharacterized protein J3R85_008894 [Psidium guajava]